MISHNEINTGNLFNQIRTKEICFAGHKKLKVYGQLNCRSGKRMNIANRIFFKDEEEAIKNGYRPCGHCMTTKYRHWKNQANDRHK